MKTIEDLKKEVDDLNKKIELHNLEIRSLQEQGLKIVGKIELMDEQSKEKKK